ncbi:hypothetical protein [uncultured Prevotella sp.]|uniref:hypothetical protein n=1 Tax=uncultured Prevotella sp. TaxID=159272 RepID=UPI0025D19501|nr:hypothetical protein [uncultured Prevotella sp.]
MTELSLSAINATAPYRLRKSELLISLTRTFTRMNLGTFIFQNKVSTITDKEPAAGKKSVAGSLFGKNDVSLQREIEKRYGTD